LSERLLIGITGPTASAKTAVGIEVARALGGEVLSVDSRQIFRHMDIGTAKPTDSERARVPHHFIDVRQPDEEFSAGAFGHEARARIEQLICRGTVPVLVGGSGLYMRAILDGLFDEPAKSGLLRSVLQRRLRSEGLPALRSELEKIDPEACAKVSPNDTHRILRALEVGLVAGASLTELQQDRPGLAPGVTPMLFGIALERDLLYQRIDRRVDRMMKRGLRDEVADLLNRGYSGETRSMGTMGYREVLDAIEGRCSMDAAVELVKRRSRQYAKRQLTWFRKDRRIRWLDLTTWKIDGLVTRILSQYSHQKTP
jgi:tRNA dimethylallyltransferase